MRPLNQSLSVYVIILIVTQRFAPQTPILNPVAVFCQTNTSKVVEYYFEDLLQNVFIYLQYSDLSNTGLV